jgi:rubrerythrin
VLSARAIYDEIRNNDETYALFLSVAASGEAQGGWENARIAALTEDTELRPKIARHGTDEDKHGRLFEALLRKRGLQAVEVPLDANYTILLENAGIGLSHARLRQDMPLSDEEILKYLVHSRVTEQRAAEEVAMQKKLFGDDPDLGKAIRMISDDEDNHLAYCHEELLRFSERGYGDLIRHMLKEYALVEIKTYRRVSLAIMGRMGEKLGWPALKTAVLRLGIHAIYVFERVWGWRRMTTLRPPARRNALGGSRSPAAAA